MARKLKEITNFFKGIFAAASSSNIDDEAASYSVNVDSITNDGKLKGAPKDKVFKKTGAAFTANTDNATTIKNADGSTDLIYQDFDSNRLEVIKDLYSKTEHEVPFNSFRMGDNLSTELLSTNGNVRVGYGKNIPPKFVGKQVSGGIQDTVSTKYFSDSAHCHPPKAIGGFDKIYEGIIHQTLDAGGSGPDNNRTSKVFWGIRFNEKAIYRISVEHAGQTFDGTYDGSDYDSSGAAEQTSESGQSKFFHVQSYGMQTFNNLGGGVVSFCPATHPDFADNRTAENDWFWVLLSNKIITLVNLGSGMTNAYSSTKSEKLNHFTNDGTTANVWPNKMDIEHFIEEPDLDTFQTSSASAFTALNLPSEYKPRRKANHMPPQSARLGDILQTYDSSTGKGYVWISYYKPKNTPWDSNERFLFNCSFDTILDSSTANIKPFENKSFLIRRVSRQGNKFRAGGSSNNRVTTYYRPYPNDTSNLSEHQHWAFDGDNCSHTIKHGNWRSASQNRGYGGGYGDSTQWHFTEFYHGFKTKDNGDRLSGFTFTGDFGFQIPRLALVHCPKDGLDTADENLIDSGWTTQRDVAGQTEVEDGYKNIVGIIVWADSMMVNIATAMAYRVKGSTFHHSYRRLLGPYGYEDSEQNSFFDVLIAVIIVAVGAVLTAGASIALVTSFLSGWGGLVFTTLGPLAFVGIGLGGLALIIDGLSGGNIYQMISGVLNFVTNSNFAFITHFDRSIYGKGYEYLGDTNFAQAGEALTEEIQSKLQASTQLWHHDGFNFEYGEINQAIAWVKPKRRGHLPNQGFYLKRGNSADTDREMNQHEYTSEIDASSDNDGDYLFHNSNQATFDRVFPEPSQHDIRFSCITGLNTGNLDFKIKAARTLGNHLFLSGYSGVDETIHSKETLILTIDLKDTNINMDRMVYPYTNSWFWEYIGADTSSWPKSFEQVGNNASRNPYVAFDGNPNKMLKSITSKSLSPSLVSETISNKGFLEIPSMGAGIFCLGNAPNFNNNPEVLGSDDRFLNLDEDNVEGTLYLMSTVGRLNYIASPFEKIIIDMTFDNSEGESQTEEFLDIVHLSLDCCNSIHKQIGTITLSNATTHVLATLGDSKQHYLHDGDFIQINNLATTYFLDEAGACYTDIDGNRIPGVSRVEVIDGERFKCIDFKTGLSSQASVVWKRIVPGSAGHSHGRGGRGANATRLIDLQDIGLAIEADTRKEASDAGLYFSDSMQYRYKVSFIYDGVQDSPLSDTFVDWTDDDWTNLDDGSYGDLFDGTANPSTLCLSQMFIKVKIANLTDLSPRITGINLWRLEYASKSTLLEVDTESKYSLVKTLPFDEGDWSLSNINNSYNQLTISPNPGLDANPYSDVYETIVSDSGSSGLTFESWAGFSQVLKSTAVNYKLSTQIMDMMFVSNISIPYINSQEISRAVLRSSPGKLDTFDYVYDNGNITFLPNVPTAMISFKGNLYIWDIYNMYKMDPNTMAILDTFEGTGCIGNHTVERTEIGIMFADEHHIFLFDGEKVLNLGIPLAAKGEDGIAVEITSEDAETTNIPYITWKSRDKSFPSYIRWEPKRRSFCVFFRASAVSENSVSLGQNVTNEFQAIIDSYDNYSDGILAAQIEYPDAIQLSIPVGESLESDENPELQTIYIIPADPNFNVDLLAQDLYKEGTWEQDVCFMFNVDRKRWDIVFLEDMKGVFYGGYGEILFSGQTTDNDFFDLENLSLPQGTDADGNVLTNVNQPFILAQNSINISSNSNASNKLLIPTSYNAHDWLDTNQRQIGIGGDITLSCPPISVNSSPISSAYVSEYNWDDLHVWSNINRCINGETPTWWIENNDGTFTQENLSANDNTPLIVTSVQNNFNTNINPSFTIDYSQTGLSIDNGMNLEDIKVNIDTWYENEGISNFNELGIVNFSESTINNDIDIPDSIVMYNSYPGFEDVWTNYNQNNYNLPRNPFNVLGAVYDSWYSEIGVGSHFPVYSKPYFSIHNALYKVNNKENYYNRAMPSTSPFLFHASEDSNFSKPRVSLSFLWGYIRGKSFSDEDIDTYIYHNTMKIDNLDDTLWKTGHQKLINDTYTINEQFAGSEGGPVIDSASPFMMSGGPSISYKVMTNLGYSNYNNYVSSNKYLGNLHDGLMTLGHWTSTNCFDNPADNEYGKKRQYSYADTLVKLNEGQPTKDWYVGGYQLGSIPESDLDWYYFADGFDFTKYIVTGNNTVLSESSQLLQSVDYNFNKYDDFKITLKLEAPESLSPDLENNTSFNFWIDKIKDWYTEAYNTGGYDSFIPSYPNFDEHLLAHGVLPPRWEDFWKVRNLAEENNWIEKLPFAKVYSEIPGKYMLQPKWVLNYYRKNENEIDNYSTKTLTHDLNLYTEITEDTTEVVLNSSDLELNFEENDTAFLELNIELVDTENSLVISENILGGSGGKMLSNLQTYLWENNNFNNTDSTSDFQAIVKNNRLYFDLIQEISEDKSVDNKLAYEIDYEGVSPDNNNPDTNEWRSYLGNDSSLALDVTKLLTYTNLLENNIFDSRLANIVLQESGSQTFFNGLNNSFSFNCNSDIQMGMLSVFGEWYYTVSNPGFDMSHWLVHPSSGNLIGKMALERRNWHAMFRSSSYFNYQSDWYKHSTPNTPNNSDTIPEHYTTTSRVDNAHTKSEWNLQELFDNDVRSFSDIEISVKESTFGDGYGEGHTTSTVGGNTPVVPQTLDELNNITNMQQVFNSYQISITGLKSGQFGVLNNFYLDRYLDRFSPQQGKRQIALINCMRAYNSWSDWGNRIRNSSTFDPTHPKYLDGKDKPETLNIKNKLQASDFTSDSYSSPYISLEDVGIKESITDNNLNNVWEKYLLNPNAVTSYDVSNLFSLMAHEYIVNDSAYNLFESGSDIGRSSMSLVNILKGGHHLDSSGTDSYERIFWHEESNVGKFYFNRNYKSNLSNFEDGNVVWEEVASGSEDSYSPSYDNNSNYSLVKLPLRSHNFGIHNISKSYSSILNTVQKGTSGWDTDSYTNVGSSGEYGASVGQYKLNSDMKMHRFNPIHFMPNWEPNPAESTTGTVFTSNELIKPYRTNMENNSPVSTDNQVTMGIGMTAKSSTRPNHSLVIGFDNNILNLYDERKLIFGSKNNGFNSDDVLDVDTKARYVRFPLKFDGYNKDLISQGTLLFNNIDNKQFLMNAINYFGGIRALKEIRLDGSENVDVVFTIIKRLVDRVPYINENNRAKIGAGAFKNYSNLDRRGYQSNPSIAPDVLDSSKYSIYYDIWAKVSQSVSGNSGTSDLLTDYDSSNGSLELTPELLQQPFRFVFDNGVVVNSNGIIYNADGSVFIQEDQSISTPVNEDIQISYEYEIDESNFFGDNFNNAMYGDLLAYYHTNPNNPQENSSVIFDELLIPSSLNEEDMQIGNDYTHPFISNNVNSGAFNLNQFKNNGPVLKVYKRLPFSVSIIREELSLQSPNYYPITNKMNKVMRLNDSHVNNNSSGNFHDEFDVNYILENISGQSDKCNFFAHIYSGFNRDLIYNSFDGINRDWTYFTEWIPNYTPSVLDSNNNMPNPLDFNFHDMWVNNPVMRPYSRKINNWKLDFSVKENGLFGPNLKPERIFEKGALWNSTGDTLVSSDLLSNKIKEVDSDYDSTYEIVDSQNVIIPNSLDNPEPENYQTYTNGGVGSAATNNVYYAPHESQFDSDNIYERNRLDRIRYYQTHNSNAGMHSRWGYTQMKSFYGGDNYEIVTQISIKLPINPGFSDSDKYVWVPYIPLSIKPSAFNGDKSSFSSLSTNGTNQVTYPWNTQFPDIDTTYNFDTAFMNNHRVNQSQWNLAQNLEIEGYGISPSKLRRLIQGYIGLTKAFIEKGYAETYLGDDGSGLFTNEEFTTSGNPYLLSLMNLYSDFIYTENDETNIDLQKLIEWINNDNKLLTAFGINQISPDMVKIEVVPVLSSTGFKNDGITQTQGSMDTSSIGVQHINVLTEGDDTSYSNVPYHIPYNITNEEGRQADNPIDGNGNGLYVGMDIAETRALSRTFRNSHTMTRTFFGGEVDIKLIQKGGGVFWDNYNENNYVKLPAFEKSYPSKESYFRPEFIMEPKHIFNGVINNFKEKTYNVKHNDEAQNIIAEGLPYNEEYSLYKNNKFASKGFMFNWSRLPVVYGLAMNPSKFSELLDLEVAELEGVYEPQENWFTTSDLWVPLKPAGVRLTKDTHVTYSEFEEKNDYLNRAFGFPSTDVSVNINTSLNNEVNEGDNLNAFSPIIGEILEYEGEAWNNYNFDVTNSFEVFLDISLPISIDPVNIEGTSNLLGKVFEAEDINYSSKLYKIYKCEHVGSTDEFNNYKLRGLLYTSSTDVELPSGLFKADGNWYKLSFSIGENSYEASITSTPIGEEQTTYEESNRTDIVMSIDFPISIVNSSSINPNRQYAFGNIPIHNELSIKTRFHDVFIQDWDYTNFDSSISGYHQAKVEDVDAGNQDTSEVDSFGNYYDVIHLDINPDTSTIWDPTIGENTITLESPTLIYKNIDFLSSLKTNYVLQEFLGDDARPRPWEWHSKNFSMEQTSQKKSFIRVKITYYNTKPVVYAMFDNNKSWVMLDTWDNNNEYVTIPKELRKANSIKIKLMSASNNWATFSSQGFHDTEVDSVSIIYRSREFVA